MAQARHRARKAREWLEEELKAGARPARELMLAAAEHGIDMDELEEAAEDLGVIVCAAWRLPR